jgi:hypothetical protein
VATSATAAASAPSPRPPLLFHRIVVGARDSEAADDYLVLLAELTNGGLSAHVSFASGKPRDEFSIELAPSALTEARALLTIEQGNEHLGEEPTWLDAGHGLLRASRLQATTLPFLPSRRVVDESRGGRIGPIRVGDADRLPALVREGTSQFEVRVRSKLISVTAARFVVPKEAWPDEGELLLAHALPGIGDVDLVLSLRSAAHEVVVRSIE